MRHNNMHGRLAQNLRTWLTTTALLLAICIPQVSMAQANTAQNISCVGTSRNVTLEYASTSFAGVPLLRIQDRWPRYRTTVTVNSAAIGPAFTTTSTPLGRMVTYTIDAKQGKRVSFFVPANASQLGDDQKFSTILIYRNVWSKISNNTAQKGPEWATVDMDCRLMSVIP